MGPSWAHWRNNSGIELLFVLILTMVFKVISLNNSPCLWSVQVPCRCLAHPPIPLDVLLYRLWFKFVLPVIVWSNFTRYGLFHCRPAPEVKFVHPVSPGGSVKFVASGVNFSIFTLFLCFFLLKLLKLGEIDGVKFLT